MKIMNMIEWDQYTRGCREVPGYEFRVKTSSGVPSAWCHYVASPSTKTRSWDVDCAIAAYVKETARQNNTTIEDAASQIASVRAMCWDGSFYAGETLAAKLARVVRQIQEAA